MLGRMTWWCTGVRWHAEGRPALGWYAPGREPRESAPEYGAVLAFRARGGRRCLGVWRGGRWTPCPVGAGVAARATRAQCEECARVDRAHSVAADTFADDPRPYHVYVAWFGPGVVKVGITRVARGGTRLLEQGAVAYSWLGRGPLMAARRAEELLRTALGVPDRIPYARKRALRARLPSPAERARELAELHRRASGLGGWPESLERLPYGCVDHGEVFGAVEATGVVSELVDGGVVAGTLVGAAGPDLHLEVREGVGRGGVVVVDGRVLSGWRLDAVAEGVGVTVPVRGIPAVQGGLF
ncbi:DUF2797 domain-containing protein [Streptomyces sp. NPDC053474]|uniref:DUF2797 domain-containing protein n=1 Tax=Streptomyces sp. NPDC053474 TaxID=3365704 RepID=UPI0037CD9B03